MADDGSGRWARETSAMAPQMGIVRAAGEERWRHFDSSVSAVSFGFVATAILIAMFLVMAIFERFLRPRAGAPPSSSGRQWRRRRWSFSRDPRSPPQQQLLPHGASPQHLNQAALAGKLDHFLPPKVSVHAQEVSVLMPGQVFPTFIAHPAPVPCPREPIAWPSRHQIPPPAGS